MNRKKRNLQYIREKNYIRKGGIIRSYFKISNEMLDDSEFVKQFTESNVGDAIKRISRKFKLRLKLHDMLSGSDGEDFIRNLTTIKFGMVIDRN